MKVGDKVGRAQRGSAPVRPMGRILELAGDQARVGTPKLNSLWPIKLLAVIAEPSVG